MANPHKLIILTGPCGVGKTTITNLLAQKCKVEVIRGDRLKNSMFPHISILPKHPNKLQLLKEELFTLSKEHFYQGKSVLIDYVILGDLYIRKYQEEFGKNLYIKVLFPELEIAIERDNQRKCWTSGREVIEELYKKYEELKELIGGENYLNTSDQSPENTTQLLVKEIFQNK